MEIAWPNEIGVSICLDIGAMFRCFFFLLVCSFCSVVAVCSRVVIDISTVSSIKSSYFYQWRMGWFFFFFFCAVEAVQMISRTLPPPLPESASSQFICKYIHLTVFGQCIVFANPFAYAVNCTVLYLIMLLSWLFRFGWAVDHSTISYSCKCLHRWNEQDTAYF